MNNDIMFEESTTPFEEDLGIEWKNYTENNYVEMQEELNTFVEENLVIQKYVRRDFNGYMDYEFTSEEQIDNAVDTDLEENDVIETDDWDTCDDTYYKCSDCDKRWVNASDFMEHAIAYIYSNTDLNTQEQVMRPSMFLSLLCDYVWNDPNGTPYQEYMERYIRSDPNRLHNFFNHMVQKNAIPQGLWDKYNSLLYINED